MIKNSDEDDKSRSQVKREFQELKVLGIKLTALSKGQLKAMPMSDRTREALLAAKGMKRTALQRQYRHLISLISEEEDIDTIRAALAGNLQPHVDEVAAVHDAEQWRDKLLSDDESRFEAFTERHRTCDRLRLRQLVRNAKKERELQKAPKSARLLYKYVKQLIDERG